MTNRLKNLVTKGLGAVVVELKFLGLVTEIAIGWLASMWTLITAVAIGITTAVSFGWIWNEPFWDLRAHFLIAAIGVFWVWYTRATIAAIGGFAEAWKTGADWALNKLPRVDNVDLLRKQLDALLGTLNGVYRNGLVWFAVLAGCPHWALYYALPVFSIVEQAYRRTHADESEDDKDHPWRGRLIRWPVIVGFTLIFLGVASYEVVYKIDQLDKQEDYFLARWTMSLTESVRIWFYVNTIDNESELAIYTANSDLVLWDPVRVDGEIQAVEPTQHSFSAGTRFMWLEPGNDRTTFRGQVFIQVTPEDRYGTFNSAVVGHVDYSQLTREGTQDGSTLASTQTGAAGAGSTELAASTTQTQPVSQPAPAAPPAVEMADFLVRCAQWEGYDCPVYVLAADGTRTLHQGRPVTPAGRAGARRQINDVPATASFLITNWNGSLSEIVREPVTMVEITNGGIEIR